MARRWHRLVALFLLLLAIAGGACARVAPEAPRTGTPVLAIVSWNMHRGRGDLARLLDDLSGPQAAARDYVVLLQEAGDEGSRDVRAIAMARGLAVAFHRTPERRIGNALVSTLPLASPRVIELPRERQPRRALVATIHAGGVPLFVASAHLENRLGWLRGLFGDRARGRQADVLIRALPAGHGILGGDMNTMLGPDEPAWRALVERFPGTPPDPEPTFRDRLVLDHLFFDLPGGWSATRRVLPDRYGSDHHPVAGVVLRSRS